MRGPMKLKARIMGIYPIFETVSVQNALEKLLGAGIDPAMIFTGPDDEIGVSSSTNGVRIPEESLPIARAEVMPYTLHVENWTMRFLCLTQNSAILRFSMKFGLKTLQQGC